MVTAKYIAGGALVALVVASLAFSTWYFKDSRDDTRLKLQDVTRMLTQEREQHDSFVNEQTLLRDILDAGHKANEKAQEAHSEAIKKHRTEGYHQGNGAEQKRYSYRKCFVKVQSCIHVTRFVYAP